MPDLACVTCGDHAGDVVIDRADAEGAGVGRLKIVRHACHADPAVAERSSALRGLARLRSRYVVATRRLLTGTKGAMCPSSDVIAPEGRLAPPPGLEASPSCR